MKNIISLGLCSTLLLCTSAWAQKVESVPGQLIVRLKKGVNVEQAFDNHNFKLKKKLIRPLNIHLVQYNPHLESSEAVKEIRKNPNVLYVQKDHKLKRRAVPNDQRFSEQWNLDNSSGRGTVHMLNAWERIYGNKPANPKAVVIAIVDGGFDLKHPDLTPNLWKNTLEVAGNGKDDDGNGYVDDVDGWNAYDKNGKITEDMHGTHVMGIAAARGGNKIGVTGVNQMISVMPIQASSGTTSIVMEGYGYALAQKKIWLQTKGQKGANVVAANSSFGVDMAKCTEEEFPAWNDMFNQMGEAGIISVAATMNSGQNVEEVGDVPTSCTSSYLLTVTNTTREDRKFEEAAWGHISIDLGAPGTDILSTLPGNEYDTLTGTSMATPHVTGAVGLLFMLGNQKFQTMVRSEPPKAAALVKKALMDTVNPIDDLKGRTVSNGRMNVDEAVKYLVNAMEK